LSVFSFLGNYLTFGIGFGNSFLILVKDLLSGVLTKFGILISEHK
jgi:hypothetical protein